MMRKLSVLILLLSLSVLLPLSASASSDDENPYTGYWWHDQNWVPGLITVETWFTPTPRYASGRATFYAPNVMRGTARWRGMSLDGYLGGIAMMSPADIGATVWLRRPDHPWEGPYLVVDSAARHDMYPVVLHRREIIEVDFATARRWDMVEGGAGNWSTHRWVIDDVEVIKSERLPMWAARVWVAGEQPHVALVNGYLNSVKAMPVDYPEWFADQVTFASEWEPHPYYVRPGLWNMRDGSPPKAWDDFPIEPPLFTRQPESG